jgi:hypothetical protein
MPNDQSPDPNGDPQEIAGPEGSEVKPHSAEQTPQEASEDREDIEYSLSLELLEQFPVEPIVVGISPDDGLPVPMDGVHSLPVVPNFGPDTVVCIEDTRQYVEVFQGEDFEIDETVDFPAAVQKAMFPSTRFRSRENSDVSPSNEYCPLASKYDESGKERQRATFSSDRVEERWGAKFVFADGKYMLVRPIRERCKHYKRMVFANDDTTFKPGEFGHQVLYRNCMARRSVGGALMSVNNEAVYACDHREPFHKPSVDKYLDGPDRERTIKKVEMVPLFNLEEK